MFNNLTNLSPLIKWAGGKEKELKYILPNLPVNINRFVEPFVGGGALYFAINANKKFINDKSAELINFYNDIKYNNDEFVENLQGLYSSWLKIETLLSINLVFFEELYFKYKKLQINKKFLEEELKFFINDNKELISDIVSCVSSEYSNVLEDELFKNLSGKFARMKELEKQKGKLSHSDLIDNFECALKSSFYMFIRFLYNKNHFTNSHYFYFIREYCYSSMFRYNLSGEFNVPYGGISYNKKNFQKKIDCLKSEEIKTHFSNTDIFNLDFEDFLNQINLQKDDFVFLDPPYDSDFSSYVNNSFDKNDQERLANYLLNNCPTKFLLIIKDTEFINSLYSDKGLQINSFDKKYMVSFKNRNNRDCKHLMISNYKLNDLTNIKEIEAVNQLQYA